MSKQRIAPFRATDLRHLAVSSLRDVGLSRTDHAVLSKHMAHSLHTADKQYDESRQFGARLNVLERDEDLAREAAREEFEVGYVDRSGTRFGGSLIRSSEKDCENTT